MSNDRPAREKLIHSITAPLGFFVLALLVVEAFIAAVIIGADLTADVKALALWVGIGGFFVVVSIVSIFVWFKPDHLVFDKEVLSERMRHRDYLEHRAREMSLGDLAANSGFRAQQHAPADRPTAAQSAVG